MIYRLNFVCLPKYGWIFSKMKVYPLIWESLHWKQRENWWWWFRPKKVGDLVIWAQKSWWFGDSRGGLDFPPPLKSNKKNENDIINFMKMTMKLKFSLLMMMTKIVKIRMTIIIMMANYSRGYCNPVVVYLCMYQHIHFNSMNNIVEKSQQIFSSCIK